MSFILQFIRKHKLGCTLFAVVFYQILCALQGVDLTDEGWGMYFYQQIFKNPECVTAQMPYWVTGLIGGIWDMLFPSGGFLWMRIFGIILTTGTFYLSYTFLKKSIASNWLLVGLVAQIVIVAGDPKPYGYNSLTAFFVLLAVMSLWRGLERRKYVWLFIGGFLLGINVFVRIPNIAILPIILLIPIYSYWQSKKIGLFSSQLWTAIVGIITGMGIVVLAMWHWGYWALFMESFSAVANSATDASNSHQFGRLITRYLLNYSGILIVGAVVTLVGCIYLWLYAKIRTKKILYCLHVLCALILVFGSMRYNEILRDNDMFFAQFISYIGAILILINYNRSKCFHLRYAALASLFMIVLIPLGSDQGVVTMWTSAWLALPLGAAYLYNLSKDGKLWESKLKRYFSYKSGIRSYLGILFLAYIGCGLYKNDNLAYYDPDSRLTKVHSIDNSYCRLIYTNSYRARLINELLPALQSYVKPNDYLMVYNFMPGLNYMTNTRSYVSNAWLWGLSGSELKQQLDKSLSEKKILPVVVRQHFVAANKWQEYDPFYTDATRNPENVLSRNDQTKAFNDFLEQNHYITVWTNRNFEILLPEKP